MNQVFVYLRVRGVLRQEGNVWVAGFPRLDVYSQGNTPEEAKENASDALRLWVDSCLDRGTLGDALRDLGWRRNLESSAPPPDYDADEPIEVHHVEDVLGQPWDEQIKIPAYQAADFLTSGV